MIEVGAPVPELLPVLAGNRIDVDSTRLRRLPGERLVGVPAAIARNDHEVAGAVGIEIGSRRAGESGCRTRTACRARADSPTGARPSRRRACECRRSWPPTPDRAIDVGNHDLGAAIAVEVGRQRPVPHGHRGHGSVKGHQSFLAQSRCPVAIENAASVGIGQGLKAPCRARERESRRCRRRRGPRTGSVEPASKPRSIGGPPQPAGRRVEADPLRSIDHGHERPFRLGDVGDPMVEASHSEGPWVCGRSRNSKAPFPTGPTRPRRCDGRR